MIALPTPAPDNRTEPASDLVLASIELRDPSDATCLPTLRDLGVDILGRLGERSYLCRVTSTALPALRSLRFVAAIVLVAPGKTLGAQEGLCGQVVDRLIARFGVGLLARQELIKRTLAADPGSSGGDGDSLTRLSFVAFGVYNEALYSACSGAEGPVRREIGLGELSRVLHARARAWYPDVCADAAQSALERVHAQLERCREPRTFLIFASYYLKNAARRLRRQERLTFSLESDLADQGAWRLGDAPGAAPNPLDEVLSSALGADLRVRLDAFAQKHPRARNQLAAVRLKYIDNLDDATIGRILGVAVKRVHELRSLGLKKLRSDPHLRAYL
jgi:DNA-directed RNA polymerase specialized sigma24 family protein